MLIKTAIFVLVLYLNRCIICIAEYLKSSVTSCSRLYSDIETLCDAKEFQAQTYFSGFEVLRVYEHSVFYSYDVRHLIVGDLVLQSPDTDLTVSVDPVLIPECIGPSINTACSLVNSTRLDNGSCEDAVVQVVYTIGWDASDITQVQVQFVYKTLSPSDLPAGQVFQTIFLKVCCSVSTRASDVRHTLSRFQNFEEGTARSGSPGYVAGLPVLAGRIMEYVDQEGDTR